MSGGFDERELAVARLYAGATLQLAETAGASESVLEELTGLGELLDRDPRFELALSSPLVDVDVKRELLETAFRNQASDLVVNSLQVMGRKGRLSLLRAYIEGYRQEFEAMRGITEVDIIVAEPLSPAQRKRAQQVAEKWTGGQVRLVELQDPEVIGGMVFRAGDRKLDRSVARELDAMAGRLFERASEQIQSLDSIVD
ncbi:MAG: ATP synthase F1 subunit delta [bacterium]|nr:ATP synthase F1 subunit delta [bacterium]